LIRRTFLLLASRTRAGPTVPSTTASLRSVHSSVLASSPLASRPIHRRFVDPPHAEIHRPARSIPRFIHTYSLLHDRPPAEADMQRYFRVTPPPSIAGSSSWRAEGSFDVDPASLAASRCCLKTTKSPGFADDLPVESIENPCAGVLVDHRAASTLIHDAAATTGVGRRAICRSSACSRSRRRRDRRQLLQQRRSRECSSRRRTGSECHSLRRTGVGRMLPQSRAPPHPSATVPQVALAWAHVVGTQVG